jgi:DNA-nicking Smr family endonuclease
MYDDNNDDKKFRIWQFYTQSVRPIEKNNFLDIKNSQLDNPIVVKQEDTDIMSVKKSITLNKIQKTLRDTEQGSDKKIIKIHHHTFDAEKNTKKRMKRGRFIYDAKIDLHGQTQDQAFDNLQKFITHHYKKHIRHLLIITGRGRYCYQTLSSSGVLIKKVPEWLKQMPFAPMISVIEQASSYDGGEGALYIILRNT